MTLPIRRTRTALVAGVVSLALVAAACGGDDDDDAGATTSAGSDATGGEVDFENLEAATLNASGATFPKAFYDEAIFAFSEVAPSVTVNPYPGGGSGKGRQDLADEIVDWAGTDSPIKEEDLPGFKGGEVLYFPTVVAPITLSYNLGGVDQLQLDCPVVAKIFQREITTWSDPEIAAINEGVELPDTPITVAVRSDSSGTTDNFSKFLDRGCGEGNGDVWTLKTGSTIEWPAGVSAGNGNSGVSQIVTQADGAIGYVDLSDAIASGLTFAAVQNKAGNFVEPTLEAASAAAAGAEINPDLTYSAIWADGDDAYPITAQTWIIVYKVQPDAAKGQALKAFLSYVLTEGQDLAETVDFAPLPEGLDAQAIAQLDMLEIG